MSISGQLPRNLLGASVWFPGPLAFTEKNAGNAWGLLSSFFPLDLGAQELMAQRGESNTLPQVGTDPEVKLTPEFVA